MRRELRIDLDLDTGRALEWRAILRDGASIERVAEASSPGEVLETVGQYLDAGEVTRITGGAA